MPPNRLAPLAFILVSLAAGDAAGQGLHLGWCNGVGNKHVGANCPSGGTSATTPVATSTQTGGAAQTGGATQPPLPTTTGQTAVVVTSGGGGATYATPYPQPTLAPQLAPQQVPQPRPQATPYLVPQPLAQPTPVAQPQRVPQLVPQPQPQPIPQRAPQLQPQPIPQRVPVAQPQRVPQQVPRPQPQAIPQRAPTPPGVVATLPPRGTTVFPTHPDQGVVFRPKPTAPKGGPTLGGTTGPVTPRGPKPLAPTVTTGPTVTAGPTVTTGPKVVVDRRPPATVVTTAPHRLTDPLLVERLVPRIPGRQPPHQPPRFGDPAGETTWTCHAAGFGRRRHLSADGRARFDGELRFGDSVDSFVYDAPARHPRRAGCLVAIERRPE